MIFQYENCQKKFFRHTNVEVLSYLARAYFRAGKLQQAMLTLIKVSARPDVDYSLLLQARQVEL